jgi:uncharacterized protein (DUF2236 family)
MAAVAAHSGYRGDPWGRLQRTAGFIATTTFGADDAAAQVIAVVKAVHERISGTTPDGLYYEASDPYLLRWVHMAEIDSFLMAHQRYGRVPLTPAECDEYVEQTAVIARELGATDVPTTLDALHRELAAYRPELRGTPEAIAAARFLLLTPPLPVVVRPAYGLVVSAGVAMMPGWSRRPLGLPYLPLLERTVVHAVGRLMTAAIRWALDSAPPGTDLPVEDRTGERPPTRRKVAVP